MNNKFLKPTLHFGLGISLLMTLVACPAEREEIKEIFDPKNYTRDYENYPEGFFARRILGEANGKISGGSISIGLNNVSRDWRTTLNGPIRKVQENTFSDVNLIDDGQFQFYEMNINILDKITHYYFNRKGLLTGYDTYLAFTGDHMRHGILSYDEYDNLASAAEFNGDGVLQEEEAFSVAYDAEGLMLTRLYSNGKASPGQDEYKSFSRHYNYEYADYHPNSFPKTINTFQNDTLIETREFDDKGKLISSSRFPLFGSSKRTEIYEYDEYGKTKAVETLIYRTDSVIKSESQYFYDEQGRLTKYNGSSFSNQIFNWEYDSLGRVVKKSMNNSFTGEERVTDLTYDEEGYIIEIKESGRRWPGRPFEYTMYSFNDYDIYGNPTLFTITENGKMTSVIKRKLEYYE